MEAVNQLLQAITALYGGAPGAQQQANTWLDSFSKQPAAWEACLALLEARQSPEICFFAANMLLTKVRGEWHKLEEGQRSQMASAIG